MLYRYYNYTIGAEGYQIEHLSLMELPVISYTKFGAWVHSGGRDKFVNFNHRSAFAYRTKEDAFINYRCRKLRQIKILRGQLERAIETSKLTMENTNIGGLTMVDYEYE